MPELGKHGKDSTDSFTSSIDQRPKKRMDFASGDGLPSHDISTSSHITHATGASLGSGDLHKSEEGHDAPKASSDFTQADKGKTKVTAESEIKPLTEQEIDLKLWKLKINTNDKNRKTIQHQQILVEIVREIDENLFNSISGELTVNSSKTGKKYNKANYIIQARKRYKERHKKGDFDVITYNLFTKLQESVNVLKNYPYKLAPTEKDDFEAARALLDAHDLIYTLGLSKVEAIHAFHEAFRHKMDMLSF